MSLNLCIIDEIDENTDHDHDDEASYLDVIFFFFFFYITIRMRLRPWRKLDVLISDEMVQHQNSSNAFTTV